MHGRDYCRYSRAVFSEEVELFKALIFFALFRFTAFSSFPIFSACNAVSQRYRTKFILSSSF